MVALPAPGKLINGCRSRVIAAYALIPPCFFRINYVPRIEAPASRHVGNAADISRGLCSLGSHGLCRPEGNRKNFTFVTTLYSFVTYCVFNALTVTWDIGRAAPPAN